MAAALARRVLALGVASLAAGCALFTSLDGFSEDEPSADGGAPERDAEARSDASGVDAGGALDAADGRATCEGLGGRAFRDHCYFVLPARTQPEARLACVEAGAHLATIGDGDEQALVSGLAGGARWIGLEAKAPSTKRADYAWITGEPSTFEFWLENNPDADGRCAVLHEAESRWADRACDETNVAICERE